MLPAHIVGLPNHVDRCFTSDQRFTLLPRYGVPSLLFGKRHQRRGSDWSRFSWMRYGNSNTRSFVPSVTVGFRSNPYSPSLRTGCWTGDRLEQYLAVHLFTGGAHRMFNPLMLLAAEASGVIALRMMKLMRGGRSARREANLMVSEKIKATIEATASLVAGASGDEIVHRYRQHVAQNAKRLSGRSRKRARSRRK
jgi:hypothetical protein